MRGGRQFRLAILDIGVNRVFVRGYIWCVNARSIFRVENDLCTGGGGSLYVSGGDLMKRAY